MLTLEIFNCVVKTVLFKPTELVEQNEGQCVGWKDARKDKILMFAFFKRHIALLSLHHC